ncbi:hypothetical protein [Niveispirillum lacus]|uniref:hypothetical protein n=1 Tax=Niveispirillum lacus TaxID=1981099 RepID=UPI000B9627AA|nr:hypothetical protein [Niveispirillum lacus]
MKTRIAVLVFALALSGCSTPAVGPGRTVADTTCESGQRAQEFAPRLPGIKRYGPRWRDGECVAAILSPAPEVK